MKSLLPFSYACILNINNDQKKSKEKNLQSACKEASKLIKLFKEKCGTPAISVEVNLGSKYVINYDYGYSDVENLQKCKKGALMRIASISKSFTSLIAMKLVEEGLLDLDKDIRMYYSKFPTKYVDNQMVEITSRDLLSHRGGIRHYKIDKKTNEYECSEFLSTKHCYYASEGLDIFENDPLEHKPGTKFSYTTYGYVLLGAVLETLAKKSIFFNKQQRENYSLLNVFDKLFTYLQLDNTYCEFNNKILQGRVKQYRWDKYYNALLQIVPYVDNSCKWAGGGLMSTCSDLNKLGVYLSNIWLDKQENALINKESLKKLWTLEYSDSMDLSGFAYGLGWMIRKSQCNKRLEVCHTGGAAGGTSILYINVPMENESNESKDYVVVSVLCNMENLSTNITKLASSVAEIFLEK